MPRIPANLVIILKSYTLIAKLCIIRLEHTIQIKILTPQAQKSRVTKKLQILLPYT